jgi:hypothetical protein
MEANIASLLSKHRQDEIVSALSKLQCHIYIFQNRQAFRIALEHQLKAFEMKLHLLTLDMPV